MDAPPRKRGFSKAFWIVLAVVLLFFFWLSMPRVDGPPARSKVSQARSEMRTLALAINAYFADNQAYPIWGIGENGPGRTETYNHWVVRSSGKEWRGNPSELPSFALSRPAPPGRFGTLTTPLSYLTQYPRDPLSNYREATFVYWSVVPGQPDPSGKIVAADSPTTKTGWILVSPGPDRQYDIAGKWDAYNPNAPQPSSALLLLSYDPTNGTISDGDIFRVKE